MLYSLSTGGEEKGGNREKVRGEGLSTMLIWNNIIFVLGVYRLVMRRHVDVCDYDKQGITRGVNELPSLGILSRQKSYIYSC